ncbi:NB-ARC domain-containing protein, partial [Trichodesmium erythraeum 21-75]|nr:NB-ARC domain-containing protein [Trichodesmium erythraeum 21-75]
SQPGSERTEKVAVDREKIRILAILSDAPDVDNEEEKRSLESLPDNKVETKFVDNLSREDFNNLLWDKDGWDILFFSGHSKTEGQQGRIYINNNKKHNSLTIEELKEALQTAINKGLQLAIFNSCDGLGLASSLAKLNIPAVIVMKEEVPNVIAQQFFCKFLTNFREQDNLYLAERKTKEWLRGWENKYPGASLLPVICQNKAVEILRWSQLQLVNQPKLKEETSLPISSKLEKLRDRLEELKKLYEELEEEKLGCLPEDPPQELVNKIAKVGKAIKQKNEDIKRYLQKNLHLPSQRYASFVGRENTINEIMVALKPTNPRRIIAIDGFGGIGKTAITQEIVQRSMKNNDFYWPIWKSAKRQNFTVGGVRRVDSTTVNFEEILTEIASNLGYCEVHQKKTIQEKCKLFREIINKENYLVVIDNLETMEESENLVNNLDGLFEGDSNTKVIITTRKQIGEFSHVRPFALKGLELDESLEFLRVYASERPRANEIITSVDQDKLVTIYERTEGHPLAIELIVGKLEGGFSIDRILVELEKVNFKNCESDETIYHQFYKFILFDSWNQLSKLAQKLLLNLGEFDVMAGAKIDDLINVSQMTLSEVENATSQLIKWSLVKRQGIESQQTFLVHPFTYLFVQELE